MTDPKGLSALIEKNIERNAEEYGLAVAKHSWERMPDHVDGSPRAFSNKPDWKSQSAYRFGANSMKDHLLKLVEALEFISCGCLVPPDGGQPSFDDGIKAAREAIENFKREMGE